MQFPPILAESGNMRVDDRLARARAGPEEETMEAEIYITTTMTKLMKILLLLMREEGVEIDSVTFRSRDSTNRHSDAEDDYEWLRMHDP